MSNVAVYGTTNNPIQKRHQRPRFVWTRDRKHMNRWKDLFTGKGPDIFIENGSKADDGRAYQIACYGWEHLARENRPWQRQKPAVFDDVRLHDYMHYDFKRRRYYIYPHEDMWSKVWMREDVPGLPRLARDGNGNPLLFGPNENPDLNTLVGNIFHNHRKDFSDWLYERRDDIQDPFIRAFVNNMYVNDRRRRR
ncbi:MAG: hypothetical protein Q9217_006696 [Psora testacea]